MEEFAAKGYERASYNRIIERAGVSKGAMYYYFDDKEDLYATVIHQVSEQVLREFAQFTPAITADEFWDGLQRFVTRMLAFMRQHPVITGVMKSALRLQAAGARTAAVRELGRLYRQWAEQFLVQAQGLGAVRCDLPFDLLVTLVVAVASASDEWTVEHMDELTGDEPERIAALFVDLMRRGLEPD
jgi:AcrR family transcriptional regulator